VQEETDPMKLGPGIALAGVAALAVLAPATAAEVGPTAVKFNDIRVEQPLTGTPGDPTKGADAFKDRKLGNCLACHATEAMASEQFHGDVGPPLDGVGSRYSTEELRAIVVNSKAVFGPETVMPGFYSLDVGKDVAEEHAGKTILPAQAVEDIVAFLTTLKE